MSGRVLINCVGVGSTVGGDWPAGAYLASYTPEANGGYGNAVWTEDPAQALVFDNTEAAYKCYLTVPGNRPVRADGKPNRPLRVFAIEVVPLTVEGRPAPSTGKTMVEIFRGLGQR